LHECCYTVKEIIDDNQNKEKHKLIWYSYSLVYAIKQNILEFFSNGLLHDPIRFGVRPESTI